MRCSCSCASAPAGIARVARRLLLLLPPSGSPPLVCPSPAHAAAAAAAQPPRSQLHSSARSSSSPLTVAGAHTRASRLKQAAAAAADERREQESSSKQLQLLHRHSLIRHLLIQPLHPSPLLLIQRRQRQLTARTPLTIASSSRPPASRKSTTPHPCRRHRLHRHRPLLLLQLLRLTVERAARVLVVSS